MEEVVVNPGDIIIGDDDGVVIIRRDDAEELYKLAKAKNDAEKQIFNDIENSCYDRTWVDKTLNAAGCEIIGNQYSLIK